MCFSGYPKKLWRASHDEAEHGWCTVTLSLSWHASQIFLAFAFKFLQPKQVIFGNYLPTNPRKPPHNPHLVRLRTEEKMVWIRKLATEVSYSMKVGEAKRSSDTAGQACKDRIGKSTSQTHMSELTPQHWPVNHIHRMKRERQVL